MGAQIEIKMAQDAAGFSVAKELILEYVQWLGIDRNEQMRATLSAQNFDKEMNSLAETYADPDGRLFIAWSNDQAVGVAGIKRFNDEECEVKRMYVQPGSRGSGIGNLLLTECIQAAKTLGYHGIKLDTADFMKSAIKLYAAHGFVEIPAYRYNLHEEARYFELVLQ